MLRSETSGHRPRAPLQWRVILARIREQHWRIREQNLKESENGEFLRMHALDDMLHWRDPVLHWQDPVERLRTLRRRRRTLMDDNPCSG